MALFFLSMFTVSYFLHLTSRFPSLGEARLDLILGGVTLLVIIMQQGMDSLRLNEATSQRLNLFLLYVLLSIPLVTWPGSVVKLYLLDWFKVVLFYVLVVGAVRSEKQLRVLLTVFLACQTFRVLEPLYLHVTTGYWGDVAFSQTGGVTTGLTRLSGAPHDIVNPNQLAWVIVSTVPFIWYLLWHWGGKGKLISLVIFLSSIKALMLTGSRSGLLCLGAVIVGIVALSKNRKRNILVSVTVLIPLILLFISFQSSDIQTRYLSLIDSNVVGADTASGRVRALVRQLGSISNNPLFGNGLGTSGETNWNVLGVSSQITHNLYIEIFQETGLIGFALFVFFLISIVRSLMKARHILINQNNAHTDWLLRLTSATLVWVFMDLFYSLSCFGLRSWEWYFFGGVATVVHVLTQEKARTSNAEVEYARE
jgi:O-antigen ligase